MQKRNRKQWMAGVLAVSMVCSLGTVPVKAKQKLVKPAIQKVYSASQGQLIVVYKKTAKAKKYQIQISKDKKFKKQVKKKQAGAKVTKVTFKGLAKGTYYVRVRSQYKVGAKKKYSAFSKVKKIVLKAVKKTVTDTKNTATPVPTKNPAGNRYDDDWLGDLIFGGGGNGGNTGGASTPKPITTPDTAPVRTPEPTEPTAVPEPIDLSNFTVDRDKTTLFYNGKEQHPSMLIMSDDYYYLKENIDYNVTYTNNVNAGTAEYCIKGIGNYAGEIRGTFEIEKNVPKNDGHFLGKQVAVGDTVDVVYDEVPEGVCTYRTYDYDGGDEVSDVIEVNDKGQLIPKKAGVVDVKVSIAASRNYIAMEYKIGTLHICNDKNPVSGLDVITYSDETTDKTATVNALVENNTETLETSFYSEASDAWIDQHVRFEVEDATPPAYTRAFKFAGQDCTAPSLKVENTTEQFRKNRWYGEKTVVGPVFNNAPKNFDQIALSSRKIIITAGNGVRVCKVKAYVDDVLYDVSYLAASPHDEDDNSLDDELYTLMRHKIEARLWTDDMTNLQKLYALANYINNTTHYPGAGCTKKDINPTFYNDFSVDGIGLFYYLFPMPTLNRVMDLQGGITTCIGVTVVQRAATEDLKLPYLYDSSTKTVADGEGVWLAVGSASSNPSVGSHYSVIYKDANEHKSFVDCQGLIADTTCEQHGCRAKVIQ